MKRMVLFSALGLCAGLAWAADSNPKDEVKAAAKQLADKPNYSWRTTVQVPPDARVHPGPTEGKTEKGGYTFLELTREDTTTDAVLKDGKGVMQTEEGWTLLSEVAQNFGGGPSPRAFMARMLQSYKLPAAEALDLADKAKELKLAEGVYSGEMTEAAAKDLLSFRRASGGGAAPEATGAKGSVRFWLKDGLLSKYEFKLEGKISFQGNEINVDRTTTVELKEAGTTKVVVPPEAVKKLS